jgi:hypothetical protein
VSYPLPCLLVVLFCGSSILYFALAASNCFTSPAFLLPHSFHLLPHLPTVLPSFHRDVFGHFAPLTYVSLCLHDTFRLLHHICHIRLPFLFTIRAYMLLPPSSSTASLAFIHSDIFKLCMQIVCCDASRYLFTYLFICCVEIIFCHTWSWVHMIMITLSRALLSLFPGTDSPLYHSTARILPPSSSGRPAPVAPRAVDCIPQFGSVLICLLFVCRVRAGAALGDTRLARAYTN